MFSRNEVSVFAIPIKARFEPHARLSLSHKHCISSGSDDHFQCTSLSDWKWSLDPREHCNFCKRGVIEKQAPRLFPIGALESVLGVIYLAVDEPCLAFSAAMAVALIEGDSELLLSICAILSVGAVASGEDWPPQPLKATQARAATTRDKRVENKRMDRMMRCCGMAARFTDSW